MKTYNTLLQAMSWELDTKDKRYMFLRIAFPPTLIHINIEGSPRAANANIINYFEDIDSLNDLREKFTELMRLEVGASTYTCEE